MTRRWRWQQVVHWHANIPVPIIVSYRTETLRKTRGTRCLTQHQYPADDQRPPATVRKRRQRQRHMKTWNEHFQASQSSSLPSHPSTQGRSWALQSQNASQQNSKFSNCSQSWSCCGRNARPPGKLKWQNRRKCRLSRRRRNRKAKTRRRPTRSEPQTAPSQECVGDTRDPVPEGHILSSSSICEMTAKGQVSDSGNDMVAENKLIFCSFVMLTLFYKQTPVFVLNYIFVLSDNAINVLFVL